MYIYMYTYIYIYIYIYKLSKAKPMLCFVSFVNLLPVCKCSNHEINLL